MSGAPPDPSAPAARPPALPAPVRRAAAAGLLPRFLERPALPPPAVPAPAYPVGLEETVVLRSGRAVTLRPIRAEDVAAHLAFLHRLSADDIRYRFFGQMKEPSTRFLARLTRIDYVREMAFIATAPDEAGAPETLGVVRLVLQQSGRNEAEFAIVVRSDLKGQGLGWLLMGKAIAWAKARGLAALTGSVLADNRPMLDFVRRLGFVARYLAEDPGIIEVRLDLAGRAP